MMSLSAATEIAKDLLDQGKIADVAAANVLIVQMMGVRLIDSQMPAAARKALNAAVKAGELGHLPKKGLLPEAYFHKNAKPHAKDLRERVARESIAAIQKVCV